jgi:hypothetical protein
MPEHANIDVEDLLEILDWRCILAHDAKLCCVYVCMHDANESLLRQGRVSASRDETREEAK